MHHFYGKLDPSIKYWDDKKGATWMTKKGDSGMTKKGGTGIIGGGLLDRKRALE